MIRKRAASVAARYEKALAFMAGRNAPHAKLIESLAGLIAARAGLAASLDADQLGPLPPRDRALFLQGKPLAPRAALSLTPKALVRCREVLVPEMSKAFPAEAQAIQALDRAFASGRLRLAARLKAYLARDAVPEEPVLAKLGATPQAAALFLGQLAKVTAEAVAAAVGTPEALAGWTRGYCPVCGSPAEISYLEGKEGRRRLGCALCAATWGFTRVACPGCETTDHEAIELFYDRNTPQERAEACHACRRYILAVDRRERDMDFIPALEPLGLVYLDILMQGKGYSPVCADPAVAG